MNWRSHRIASHRSFSISDSIFYLIVSRCVFFFLCIRVIVYASNKYVHGIQYLRHHIAFGIDRRVQMELVPVLP